MSEVFKRIPTIIYMLLIVMALSPVGLGLASSDGGGHGGAQGWATTDWARVLNFSILLAALVYLFFKVGSPKLNERIKGIQEQLEDLEKKKREAETKLAEYNQKLSAIDKEAEEIIAQYRKQGEDARARILEESKKAAEKMEEHARKNIEDEFSRAKKQLQADVLEKALIKAEELIRSRISSDDQKRLVSEYLDKVVAQ
jgi:F-type H+-transporting ATPase subunit b